MKTKFEEFITESKNYPIYKGVNDISAILNSGVIKDSGQWGSPMRTDMGIKDGISVTRNFMTAVNYGDAILELDTVKLSDHYNIIPFSENPDYYLWYMSDRTFGDVIKGDKGPKGKQKNALRDKKYGKQYWDYKTNKKSMDFNIAEEVILAKQIPIKYIKKVYLLRKHYQIEELLDKNNIPYEVLDYEDKYLSKINLKNKKIKTYSQK